MAHPKRCIIIIIIIIIITVKTNIKFGSKSVLIDCMQRRQNWKLRKWFVDKLQKAYYVKKNEHLRYVLRTMFPQNLQI